MAGNDRHHVPLRLSADHFQRLSKAAKNCGQTLQAFVSAAVLAEVAEVEERTRMKKLRVRPREPEHEQEFPSFTGPEAPRSGLIEALRQQRQQEPEPAPTTPSPQGQVVVNVGETTTPQGGDLIKRLAAYVTAGDDLERDARLRTAVDILRVTAMTPEEQKVAAARLDEAVATQTKSQSSGIARAARMTFDKLAGLLGGDE